MTSAMSLNPLLAESLATYGLVSHRVDSHVDARSSTTSGLTRLARVIMHDDKESTA